MVMMVRRVASRKIEGVMLPRRLYRSVGDLIIKQGWNKVVDACDLGGRQARRRAGAAPVRH